MSPPVAQPDRGSHVLHSLQFRCLLMAAACCAYHRALWSWMTATGERLGAIDARQIAPLHASWERSSPGYWLLPALLVLVCFLALSGKIYRGLGVSSGSLLGVSFVFFLAIGPSVAMIDGFREIEGRRVPALLVPYTKAHLEYLGNVPQVEQLGVRAFLNRYAKPSLFRRLSLHPKTHPPGGVIFQWLVSRLFGRGLWAAALASIAFAGLTAPLVYLLGRDLYGEAAGRTALAVFLVTPNFVMFATTSMDGVFAMFPVLSFWLVQRAVLGGPFSTVTAALAGLALTVGSLMTYAMVCMAALFGLPVMLARHWPVRFRRRRMIGVLGVAGFTVLALYGLLWLVTGYSPMAAVRASMAHDEALMGGTGHETFTRYLNLSTANVAAFLIGIGVAIAVQAIQEAVGALAALYRGETADGYVLTVTGTILAMAFSTLFTLEVERVWLFMVPFIAVAVAPRLQRAVEDSPSRSRFYWVIGLSCAQLLVFEAVLQTGW